MTPKFQSPEACSTFNMLPYLQLLFEEEQQSANKMPPEVLSLATMDTPNIQSPYLSSGTIIVKLDSAPVFVIQLKLL